MRKKAYIIAGPTASGKSAFSLALARAVQGEIINADSMQVYADVPLLTARPDETEQEGLAHHLYGYLDAFATSSVSEWLQQVQKIWDSIETPVFVGGTGMYLKSLIEGISNIPDIPLEIRTRVRQMPPEEMKALLPEVRLTDPQRLMRALEVWLATGKTIQYWHEQPKKPLFDADFKVICLLPPREQLYLRCNYRFEQMVQKGALRQVEALLKANPAQSGGVFKAIGVAELIAFGKGEMSLDEAIAQAQLMTRHYAKRQETWFKHQLKADVVLKAPVFQESLLKL